MPYLSGKVGVIGYCSGGRQAYLAACTLQGIDAVIVCYGGGVAAKPEELTPRQPIAPIDLTKDLQCSLLGFFGIEDTRPSPDDAKKTEESLKRHGKTYEFHTYENAGHAFFAVDRAQYRVHAAVDGWKKTSLGSGSTCGDAAIADDRSREPVISIQPCRTPRTLRAIGRFISRSFSRETEPSNESRVFGLGRRCCKKDVGDRAHAPSVARCGRLADLKLHVAIVNGIFVVFHC